MNRQEIAEEMNRKITAINNLIKARPERAEGIISARKYLIGKGKL